MTSLELDRALGAERREVDQTLRRLLNREAGIPRRLKQAMRHSLFAGGKRLRPILLIWTWEAMRRHGQGPSPRPLVLQAACALELLHTYSLIHDDLPAMDDDDLRRGAPTCHVAFDEATAILAGDGLQALAFGWLAGSGGPGAGELVSLVADAVGPAGMVGGQQRDLAAEGRPISAATVREIHLGKTARLLMAAVGAGALLAGAPEDKLAALMAATRDLGLAFQGADDVLDVTASNAELGKTAGKDAAAGKATWVRVEGLPKAAARVQRLGRGGGDKLESAIPSGPHRERLLALAERLWNRKS